MNTNDPLPLPKRVVTTKEITYITETGNKTIPVGTVAYVVNINGAYCNTVSPYSYERIIKTGGYDVDVPLDCKSIGVDSLWTGEFKFEKLPASSFRRTSGSTSIVAYNDAIKNLRIILLGKRLLKRNVVVITDSIVGELYLKIIQEQFERHNESFKYYRFPAGEENKNDATIFRLMRHMAMDGIGRDTTLIGLGGGVVGDMVGLIASIYHRGIDVLVHVPTTLMAFVDSSIGGKTGVNLPQGKNLVGTFRPADLVLIDPTLTGDIPAVQWWSGVAEIIKYGAVFSPTLFQRTKQAIFKNSLDLIDIIGECITLKCNVVENDPKEIHGQRYELNFGHTFGHALEQVTEYKQFTHGAAVGLGMLVALRCGEAHSCVTMLDSMKDALIANGLPISIPTGISEHLLVEAIGRDKKNGTWILLRDIGVPYAATVSETKVREAIRDLRTKP
jgi:3-dehydroquinate synthase